MYMCVCVCIIIADLRCCTAETPTQHCKAIILQFNKKKKNPKTKFKLSTIRKLFSLQKKKNHIAIPREASTAFSEARANCPFLIFTRPLPSLSAPLLLPILWSSRPTSFLS